MEILEQCEICSKLIINTPNQRQWRRFESLLLTFHIFMVCPFIGTN